MERELGRGVLCGGHGALTIYQMLWTYYFNIVITFLYYQWYQALESLLHLQIRNTIYDYNIMWNIRSSLGGHKGSFIEMLGGKDHFFWRGESKTCQMTKIKQFSNKLNVLRLRETNAWIGECSTSQAVEHSSRGILGQSKFYKVIEAVETGHDCLGLHIWPYWRIKEQGNNYIAQSWLGVWGCTNWHHGISGHMEHLQEHKSFLC